MDEEGCRSHMTLTQQTFKIKLLVGLLEWVRQSWHVGGTMSTQVNNEGFSKNEQIVSEAIPPLLKRHTNCSGDWQQEGCIPPALAVKDIEDYFHVINMLPTNKVQDSTQVLLFSLA